MAVVVRGDVVPSDSSGGAGDDGADAWSRAGDGVVWVDAAPFRAQLAHTMAVGDMSVEVVAAMTGISSQSARRLLHGRGGRPVRRISAETGRRLLRISSVEARTVRQRTVPARGAAGRLCELLASGLTVAELAARTGIEESQLRAIAGGRRATCSPLTDAQITVAHRERDLSGDDLVRPLPRAS